MAFMIQSVEYIEVAQTTTFSGIDLTKNQNPDNCVPFMTLHGAGDTMDNHCIDIYFSGGTTSGVINFQRDETRSTTMNIKCYVVEFNSAEVKVQQGSFNTLIGGTNTAYNTPESFDQTKTAMVHYWQSTDGTNRWGRHLVRGRVLANGTQVDMYRTINGGVVSGHYFLFEDISAGNDHLIVSHQSATMTSAGYNFIIPEGHRDPTRTFLIGSMAAGDDVGSYADRQTVRIFTYFKAFSRCDRANSTNNIYFSIQHITFQDQTKVYVPFQHYTGFSTTETTINNSWDRPCNLNLSTLIATVPMGISRGSSTNASETDSLWCSMKLTSSTGAQFQRNSVGASTNSYFGYSIVDWFGVAVNTGSNPTPIDPDISFVKSVENFRMSVVDYQAQQDFSKGQVPANCAVFASQRNSGGGNAIRQSLHDVWIREPGIVVAHRTESGGDGVVDVSIVEFYPDQIKVQMSDWVMSSTGTETITLASGVVNTDRAFVQAKWEANDATIWSRNNIRVRFIDTDTLEFYRSNAGNLIAGTVFVIEDLADNFRVTHELDDDTNTFTSLYAQDYHGRYECLNISSFATNSATLYVDRGCCRSYQTGNGGRAVIQRANTTDHMYSSFQWVRFLDRRVHTDPMETYLDASTTLATQAVPAINTVNEDALSTYNSMMSCTGYGSDTGSDGMRGIFSTFRLINSNTDVEISRDITAGFGLYPSYGGLIDWIGYTHPDADEKHQIIHAVPTKSLVRSVEKFTYTGSTRAVLYYLTKGQVPENCVPFVSWKAASDDGHMDRLARFHYIDKNSKLTSATDLVASGGDLDEVVYVTEFDPAQVRVQQIWKTMTGTSVNVTIPQEVNLDKTFMLFGYAADHRTVQWRYHLVTGSFLSSTELNFSRYIASNGIYLSIYLVECLQDQWSVGHFDGPADTDTNSYDYITTDFNATGRMIQGSYSMNNAYHYVDRNTYQLLPRADSSYQWNRIDSTDTQTDRHTEAVDFNPGLGIRVGGAYIDMSGITSETKDIYVTDGIDLDRSIVFSTIVNSINRANDTTASQVGQVCVRLEITDGDTVTCNRYNKGNTTDGFLQWVEWPEPKTHYFQGAVTEKAEFVVRQVACYRSDTNEFMDSTVSASGTGEYHLQTTYSGSHYITCQDIEAAPDYNDLILGKMEPYPLPTFSGGEIIYG